MTFNFKSIFGRPNCLLNRRNRYQLLATLIVNLITFSHGCGLGWLSPTSRKLQSEDSPVGFRITVEELSWIGSLLGIGSIIGNSVIGFLLDRVGRKICIYLIAIPQTCFWILVYYAQSPEYLYVGRILAGISGGGAFVLLPIFISEIADTNIRGTLGSMVMLLVNTGVLCGYILSSRLDYYVVPYVIGILPTTYFICNLFFPESPIYLIKKGKYAEAEKAFRFYKNIKKSKDIDNESDRSPREFENLKIALTKGQLQNDNSVTLKDFVTKPALKAYCSVTVLMIVNQSSGIFAFINYMSDIVAATGTKLDPNTCTIIIGATQIFGVYTTTLLCDIYGRKILMLVSCAGVAVSLGALGLFTYLAPDYDLSAYDWLPLPLLAFDIYLGNIGIVGCFYVLLVETYPAKIRSKAAPVSVVISSILVFASLKTLPIAMVELGISTTMWMEMLWNVVAVAVYSALFISISTWRRPKVNRC